MAELRRKAEVIIKRAEHAGACYGVTRALDIANGLADCDRRVQTLGPLIHNPSVVSDLEKQGITVAGDAGDVDADTVIIRSHGVVPEVEEELRSRGLEIADATCPHVARAQSGAAELARNGCHVIVVGENGHPEVESLVAYARKNGARADVVLRPEDLPGDIGDPVGVVVQTTQIRDTLDAVIAKLREMGFDPQVKDTICSATQKRQKAAAELARDSDAMIVIGGRNSSNTTRLAEICMEICPRTYHIEDASELGDMDLTDAHRIGITAGASTPEEQISEVEGAIRAHLEGRPEAARKASREHAHPAMVSEAVPGGVAERHGIAAGESVLSVNGSPIRDFVDWLWLTDGDEIELEVSDSKGTVRKVSLERDLYAGEPWGLELDGIVFDGIMQCRNACKFCFMRQLPEGSRDALAIRDDDFRLSFLQGTYITLTNIGEGDMSRIVEQHISPLRVSLHAVDEKVRRELIGRHAQAGLDNLERLLDAGIEFDAQIVLVPGINDGKRLDETLEWAYAHPGIVNVAIVPLGFTSHQRSFDKSYDDPDSALAVLEQIRPFQERALGERGHAWAYAADELYANAHGDRLLEELPPSEFYGDYGMFEDGIGIIRSMVDSFEGACAQGMDAMAAEALRQNDATATLVSGEAMGGYAQQLVDSSALRGCLDVLSIPNEHFGGNVNVTGLLSGSDIVRGIAGDHRSAEVESADGSAAHCGGMHGKTARRIYMIPDIVLNVDGITLDGMGIEEIREKVAEQVPSIEPENICIVPTNPIDYIQLLANLAQKLPR